MVPDDATGALSGSPAKTITSPPCASSTRPSKTPSRRSKYASSCVLRRLREDNATTSTLPRRTYTRQLYVEGSGSSHLDDEGVEPAPSSPSVAWIMVTGEKVLVSDHPRASPLRTRTVTPGEGRALCSPTTARRALSFSAASPSAAAPLLPPLPPLLRPCRVSARGARAGSVGTSSWRTVEDLATTGIAPRLTSTLGFLRPKVSCLPLRPRSRPSPTSLHGESPARRSSTVRPRPSTAS